MKPSEQQKKIIDLISKHLAGNNLSPNEKIELFNLAKDNNYKVDQSESFIDGKIKKEDCYWICRGSNWSCNPNQPGPGCECIKICI